MTQRSAPLARFVLLALVACVSAPKELSPPPVEPVLDPVLVQRGGLLFLDPRVSGDGERTCASCHPGGGSDGTSYRNGEPVPHVSPGARRSPRLWGLWQTPPYLWDGSIPDLPGVLDRMLRIEMRGGSLSPIDRKALESYLLSLAPFDRGRIADDGSVGEPNTLRQLRGRELFARAGCEDCHPPPAFTHRARADVASDGVWDTPTLRGLGAVGSEPFGHDGRWDSLEQALLAMPFDPEVEVGDQEHGYLLEYLKLF